MKMPAYRRKVEIPGKNAQELYDKIAGDIDDFLAKTTLGNFDLKRSPEKKQIQLKSSMFSATLTCSKGSISLEGQLSFLAAPFKSRLDDGIDQWLKRSFESQA